MSSFVEEKQFIDVFILLFPLFCDVENIEVVNNLNWFFLLFELSQKKMWSQIFIDEHLPKLRCIHRRLSHEVDYGSLIPVDWNAWTSEFEKKTFFLFVFHLKWKKFLLKYISFQSSFKLKTKSSNKPSIFFQSSFINWHLQQRDDFSIWNYMKWNAFVC